MRLVPPPLRVTLSPQSMTSFAPLSLKTFAVRVRTIVTGSGPQSNVMTPPLATAATNASPVQLAGVPVPITVAGDDTPSAWASGGAPPGPPAQAPGGPYTVAARALAPEAGAPGRGPPPAPPHSTPRPRPRAP